MGQRHQLFIIAKIGTRYRVLAALHHQWLYGYTAVKQAFRVMNILRADRNQPHIRRELHQAAQRWNDKDNNVDDKETSAFPFLTTCLSVGASGNESGDFALPIQIQPLAIKTRYDGVQNDDGISIYDVTFAHKIRYAFVQLKDNYGSERIIDAPEYYRAYEAEDDRLERLRGILDEFSQFELVDAAALESTWPGASLKDWGTTSTTENAGYDIAEQTKAMSLKEAATAKLIMGALNSEPNCGIEAAIQTKLLEQPSTFGLPSGPTLFQRCVLKGSTKIDLTPDHSVTGEAVRMLMEHVAKIKQAYEVVLPDMNSLRVDDLRRSINTGTITALHLGKTPNIKLGSIIKLTSRSSIKHLTHPLLYSRCFDLSIGTRFAQPERSWSQGYLCGDGVNFPLRQIVYVGTLDSQQSSERLRGGGLKWSQITPSGRYSGAKAVILHMEDALMDPERLMKFIPKAVHRLVSADGFQMASNFELSQVVAGSAKQSALREGNFVSCVPGMMLATWLHASSSSREKAPKAQFMVPGEWTFVVCHERQSARGDGDKYRVRHAFATMDKEKKSVVVGAPEFFAKVLKEDEAVAERLTAECQHKMAGMPVCNAEEILEAMTFSLQDEYIRW